MPLIKIERIVSFTSEDPSFSANNILSKDTSKKWKCKTAGEKSASIVLQLDQPYIINGIDIGNENSAYIEVLVSRSTSPEDFKVLLVMSSFMTPLEARQTQNVNKVRMFKQHDFSEPERNEKWDRVKIVCTQPFNRHVQYGLSFVNLYSSDGKNVEKPQQTSFGKFTIRPDSPDNISVGSLFARRKGLQDSNSGEQTLKGAAAIREATSLAHVGSPAPKQKLKHNLPTTPNPRSSKNRNDTEDDNASISKERKERNRNELLYSKDDEEKHDKIDKLIEKRNEEKAEASKKHEKFKQADKRVDTPSKTSEKKDDKDKKRTQTPNKIPTTPNDPKTKANKHGNRASKESLKRKQSDDPGQKIKKQKKELISRPFARLLEDVVLVISGIQNPDRASLRTMAMSMGAKYKPDWDNSCSHLICAFANTPKFNQVKGKGKIVKRSWIEDCYNNRKRLPWRRYALDKADKGPESEDEICEKDDTPSPEPVEENYGINSDSDDSMREQGSDTDEKIAEIRRKQAHSKPKDIFSVDTDNESMDDNAHSNLEIKGKLNNFFEDKIFYVDENFDGELAKRIKQYIVAYNGILVENLEVSIDIIITSIDNYKVLKDIYPAAVCVAPDWIWECHNCRTLVPMKDFIYE